MTNAADTFDLIETFRLAINVNEQTLAARIARETGLSVPTVYDYLRGRFKKPRAKTVNGVARWCRDHHKEVESAIRGAVVINRRMADRFEATARALAGDAA